MKAIVSTLLMISITSCISIDVTGSDMSAKKYNNGVYEGEFSEFPNMARVKVTIKGNRITEIELLDRGGTWVGDPANEAIPERIIEKQSTNVDAVSGATRSSAAIMNAVENAVQKALNKPQGE